MLEHEHKVVPSTPQKTHNYEASPPPLEPTPTKTQAVSSFNVTKPIARGNAVTLGSLTEGKTSIHNPRINITQTRYIAGTSVPISTEKPDPLVDRFERLRLTFGKLQHGSSAPASSPLSPQAEASPPQTHTTESAQLYRTDMAVSNPVPPMTDRYFRHHGTGPLRSDAGLNLSRPIVIDDDECYEVLSEQTPNPFQRSSYAPRRMLSPQRVRVANTRRGNRRRTRSPSGPNNSQGINVTHKGPPNVSYSGPSEMVPRAQSRTVSASPKGSGARFLDSRDATVLQGELDRRSAHRLDNGQQQSLWKYLRSVSSPQLAPNSAAQEVGKSSSIRPLTSAQRGTRDNPIDVEEETDLDSSISDRAGFEDRTGIKQAANGAGEPMDLDPTDWNWASSNAIDAAQAGRDTALARQLQVEEDQMQQAPVPTRECTVCDDGFPVSALPSLAACSHPPQTCSGCYAGWVAAQLEGNGWGGAKCPERGCKVKLTYYEIQQTATTEMFQKFDTFIARTALNDDRKLQSFRVLQEQANHFSQPTSAGVDLVPPARYT
jgi:hypothetical protein